MVGRRTRFAFDEPRQNREAAARMSDRKQEIARRFGAAAPTYDRSARIQARIAEELAGETAAIVRPARILEFGCGTGNLTRVLSARFPDAQLIATDLAPPMSALCRK